MEASSESQTIDVDVYVGSQVKLAEAIGVDRKTIGRWFRDPKSGCPGKDSNGKFNVTLWKIWVQDNDKGQHGAKTKTKQELECDRIRLQNEKLEIENAVRRGELISLDEANSVLGDMMGEFVTKMRGMKHQIAPQVIGVEIGEATKRIGLEVDENLTALSLGEWAKKKAFWLPVYARLHSLHKKYHLGSGASST